MWRKSYLQKRLNKEHNLTRKQMQDSKLQLAGGIPKEEGKNAPRIRIIAKQRLNVALMRITFLLVY